MSELAWNDPYPSSVKSFSNWCKESAVFIHCVSEVIVISLEVVDMFMHVIDHMIKIVIKKNS